MLQVDGACSQDDDMLDGDLGDGMRIQGAHRSSRMKSQSFSGVFETAPASADRPRCNWQAGETTCIPGLKSTEALQRARWKLQHSGSLDQLSKDQLRNSLKEATEVIDALCCELEVAHQYFEGKYKALKILQGKAILDRATCHTQSVLQKSEEKAKALEKEVNSLQWEISFNQVQMRKCQQSWEHNYSTVVSENRSLADSLEERERELKQMRAENAALSRQCLELLSMFNVKEQRAYQETKPKYSPDRDAGILELAVLGACRCAGVVDVCPCSRAAAASRKQLIQLQQELDAQHSRREEALMVADAFRIAFEQQLRKRSEHFLLLTEANILKSHHSKSDGANRSPLMSVSQRLRGLLPSGVEVKMSDDLLDTLYRLLDLLNDKEEALAHQRKVSIMLAHSAEELQRQLLLDSHCQPPGSRVPLESGNPRKQPGRTNRRSLSHHKSHKFKNQPSDTSEFRIHSKPAQEPSGDQSHSLTPQSKNQPEMSAMSNVQVERMSDQSEKLKSQLWPDQLLCLSETESEPQGTADPSRTTVQQLPNHKKHKCMQSVIQPLDPPETRIPSKQSKELLKNLSQTDTPETMTHVPTESNIQGQQNHLQVSQSGQTPSMSESRTEPSGMCHPPHTDIQRTSDHELQKSVIQESDPPESRKAPNQPQEPLKKQSPVVKPEAKTRVSSEFNILGQQQLQCPVSHIDVRPPSLLESRTKKQSQSDPPQKNSQPFSNPKGHGSEIQQPNPPESRIPLHPSHHSKSDTPESKMQLGSTESDNPLQQNNKNHKSKILDSDPSSRISFKLGTLKNQSQCQPTIDTSESRTHSQATARSLRVQHTNTTTTRAARVSASAKATAKSVRVQD